MCDNCRHPKEKIEVTTEMHQALEAISQLNENYVTKTLVDFMRGEETQEMISFQHNKLSNYGIGKDKDENYWNSIFRHALLNNLVYKDIENYGLLKFTKKGKKFIKNPYPMEIPLNHNYEVEMAEEEAASNGKTAVLDNTLMQMLKDLRKRIAKEKNIPPFVVFQDPSLEHMATMYPITTEEMGNITGVSKGKALRYGKPFRELISDYVEENDIDRPTDFVVKQVANKSKVKVNIIQGIDRKIPLGDIASSNNLSLEELMHELDMIVASGTKVDINYYLEDNVDEYSREDIYDYFMEAETDSVDDAFNELKEDDVTIEEIQLMRIKFLSDMAN
jgi:ATP-dependent DNA helicase RecQ